MTIPRTKKPAHPPPPPASLSERLAALTPKRQETIRPVLEHPRSFVLLSVRDMAARLGSDPATILRIARSMHFPNYRSFQQFLHELSIANATSLDSMQAAPKGAGLAGAVHASLDRDMQNLHALRNSIDIPRIARLAKRIHASRRVLLVGGDLAESLVQFLQYHLLVLGFPVQVATSTGHAAYTTLSASRSDIVIAISFRKGLRQTVEGLQRARRGGAYCVGITDTYLSPVARHANEVFLSSVEVQSFGASYVAPVALLNAILVACANYKRTRTLTQLQHVEDEQKHGFRWFES